MDGHELEPSQQIARPNDNLSEPLIHRHRKLGDTGIGQGELSQGIAGNGELARAEHAVANWLNDYSILKCSRISELPTEYRLSKKAIKKLPGRSLIPKANSPHKP